MSPSGDGMFRGAGHTQTHTGVRVSLVYLIILPEASQLHTQQ